MAKKDTWQTLAAVAGIVAIILFFAYFPWGKFLALPSAPVETKTADSRTLAEYRLADDDTGMGYAEAPVLIVEFGDFMCRFCGEVHRTIEPLWRKEYIETGKARYVFRDFISVSHPQAFPAAEANECADAQGKQWEMYDLLYDNAHEGDVWTKQQSETEVVNVLKTYAERIGLDMEKFNECMESDTFVEEIRKDIVAGQSMGVTGTPTIYIGNDPSGFVSIRGAQPYAVYKQIIGQKLTP